MATTESIYGEALRASFNDDMRLLAQARKIDLSDEQLQAAFDDFSTECAELIERNGEEAVALISLPSRQKLLSNPAVDRMGGWKVVSEGGRTVHTNLRIIDLSGQAPHQNGWEKQKMETGNLSLAKVDSIYQGDQWIDARVGFDARVGIPENLRSASTINDAYLAFTVPTLEDALLVNEDYVGYFGSKVKEPKFEVNSSMTMLRVLDAEKNPVGIISLAKHAGIVTSAKDLELLARSKLYAFEVVTKNLESTAAAEQSVAADSEVEVDAVEPVAQAPAPDSSVSNEPKDWRSLPAAGAVAAIAPVWATDSRQISTDDSLAEILGVPVQKGSAFKASPNLDDDGIPVDYGFIAEPAAKAADPASASADAKPEVEGASVKEDAPEAPGAADSAASAADTGNAADKPEPEAAASESGAENTAEAPEAKTVNPEAAKAEGAASASPAAGPGGFDLGLPVVSVYSSTAFYQDQLQKRLAGAVSAEHVEAILKQEHESLANAEASAKATGEHIKEILVELSYEREVDALSFVMGRLFVNLFQSEQSVRSPKERAQDDVEASLDSLSESIDKEKAKEAEKPKGATPMINVKPLDQAVPGSGNSVSGFRKNSAEGTLSSLEQAIGASPSKAQAAGSPNFGSTPEPKPQTKAPLTTDGKFNADLPYLATSAQEAFKQLQPEHLLDDQKKIDQSWVDKVQAKLKGLEEKAAESGLGKEIMESIQKALEAITQMLSGLVDAVKKLLSGEMTKDADPGAAIDRGRIDPSFAGLER